MMDADPMVQAAREYRAARERSGGVHYPPPDNLAPPDDGAPPRGDPTFKEAPPASVTPTPFALRPSHEIPPRQWLYGKHLIRGFLSLTVSPGGLGKSSLAVVDALAMATGRDLLGAKPPNPLRIWIWNGEDPREEIERRITAAAIHYGITGDDIGGRLFVDSGRDLPITLATMNGGGLVIAKAKAESLKEAIRQRGIDVLIIDPFVTSHQVSENDNTAMNAVAAEWRKIADETGCSIELVHHVSKAGAISGDELGIYGARGAASGASTQRRLRCWRLRKVRGCRPPLSEGRAWHGHETAFQAHHGVPPLAGAAAGDPRARRLGLCPMRHPAGAPRGRSCRAGADASRAGLRSDQSASPLPILSHPQDPHRVRPPASPRHPRASRLGQTGCRAGDR